MLERVWETVAVHMRQNKLAYIMVIGAFLGGGILALVSVSAIGDLQNKELLLFMEDFFGFLRQEGADGGQIFLTALQGFLWDFVILTLCGMLVTGTPFICAFSAVKGFMGTFLVSFLIRSFGLRGLVVAACSLLSGVVILLPCYLFYMLYCLQASASAAHAGIGNVRGWLGTWCRAAAVFWGLALCAALLQGYIEPIFLQLAAGMFVA